MTRLRQLVEMLTAERNRLLRTAVKAVRRDIQKHIHWLDKQLAEGDHEISGMIKQSPAWREKADLLRHIKGVGPVLASYPNWASLTASRWPNSSAWRH